MSWHQLWRTRVEEKSGIVTVTAEEHGGQRHTIILNGLTNLLRRQPELPARDGDQLVAWLREGADELEKAHVILDQAEVPRSLPGVDVECTLAARIAMLVEEVGDLRQETYDQGERS